MCMHLQGVMFQDKGARVVVRPLTRPTGIARTRHAADPIFYIRKCFPDDLYVWSATGWNKIKKIVRHRTNKDIYRIRTKHAIVDVTEDHSLINSNGEMVKPNQLTSNTELLHTPLIKIYPQITFDEIIYKIYTD